MSTVMKAERTKKSSNKTDFTADEKNKIVEKLITARVGLLLRHPFFGNLATRLTLVDASDWCPTLATDGRKFYYNNEFVNRLTPKEAEFGFGHEILHNVFDHMNRRDSRDPVISNIAADYAANQILKDERIGTVPDWIKIFQDNKYRGKSYEEIYAELYAKADKIDFATLGELLDEHLSDADSSTDSDADSDADSSGNNSTKDGKGRPRITEQERKQIRDEIKEAMIAAAQSAGAGKVPSGIARMISDMTEPKMNWRQLLRMNIQSIVKSNYTFARPNRKSQHSGAILPGLSTAETIDIVVAIDTSGSISNEQAKDFLSEVKGIMDEYVNFKLDLLCFDTKIYNYSQFTGDNSDELADYKVRGGGGTNFMCVWDFLKEENIEPKKLIMFTDMEPYGSFGDPDYCDTMFIAHGTTSIIAPFGQTIFYEE